MSDHSRSIGTPCSWQFVAGSLSLKTRLTSRFACLLRSHADDKLAEIKVCASCAVSSTRIDGRQGDLPADALASDEER